MSKATIQQRISVCRQRFESAPESRAFAPLADCLRQGGHYEEALTLLEEGLIRHPEFHAAMVILGHTLLDTDRSEHARKVLQRVLEKDGENVVAIRLLTEDARSRQAWHEAVPLLENLTRLDPDDNRWPLALSEVRANRYVPDPADVPETSFATLTLVEIYFAQGYRAKAMTALRQILEREPDRQDVKDKIAEIGILEGTPAPGPADATLPGEQAGSGDRNYAARRELRTAKRVEEKKSFEAWIDRIRPDESPAP